MLQRLRQKKDLKVDDCYKKTTKKNEGKGDKENKWWHGNKGMSLAEAKHQKEKQRYLKALKALVYEKGEKFLGGEIPRLCSCGAFGENIKSVK